MGIKLIQIYDYKVLTLILSPETLPCKVTFIGSRDWLGPGIFAGHRFHLHLTYSTHLSCVQSTFTLLQHPLERQLTTVSARTQI